MLDRDFKESGLIVQRDEEHARWKTELYSPSSSVPFLPATAAIESRKQTMHPIKALTGGLEMPTQMPFFGGGRWRMTERVAWWNTYADAPDVVFGHYWRWPGDERHAAAKSRGPNLFEGTSPDEWLGPRRNAMCVDFCAGLRWRERSSGAVPHTGVAAAVRWPEREVRVSG